MTKEEIRKFLGNTKVYVNGKSKEIQEKLFSFEFVWVGNQEPKVGNIHKPFLYMSKAGYITCGSDMSFFKEHEYREISADEILSLEVTEPSYRPFKTKEECWNEMQKHQPFGWAKSKRTNNLYNISQIYGEEVVVKMMMDDVIVSSYELFRDFEFTDGTPFGIKED